MVQRRMKRVRIPAENTGDLMPLGVSRPPNAVCTTAGRGSCLWPLETVTASRRLHARTHQAGRPEGDQIFERQFVAYGVRIGLRIECQAQLATHLEVPCHWRAVGDHESAVPVAVWYILLTGATGKASYRLFAGANLVAEVSALTEASLALAAHAEFFVAEHAPDHLFVHAGVVGWEGRAIVMPGASFAGKTTLVQAWLDAGATYYSDEFAVLDRAGRVHPFARPLAIRDASSAIRRTPAAALGAETGTAPLPIGLILVASYRPGARWRPRRMTAAPALLALMRHTVAARGNPKHSMPILTQAACSGMALAGCRGEAGQLVAAALRHLPTPAAVRATTTQGAI
jgi:hypothetical protein